MRTPALCLLLSLVSTNAFAALVLDQEYNPGALGKVGSNTFITGGQYKSDLAQTFTVGQAGQLKAVEMYLVNTSATQPLQVELRTTAAGKPTSTVLASVSLLPSQVPTISQIPGIIGDYTPWGGPMTRFEFPGVAVTPGDVLAVSIRTTDPQVSYQWIVPSALHISDPPYPKYLGGSLWTTSTLDPDWVTSPTTSGVFRTFVDVVPEPASLALLLPAMAMGLALVRRKSL